MTKTLCRLIALLCLQALLMSPPADAAGYRPTAQGTLAGYRLAGIEPDGDPLYQAALSLRLNSSTGTPPLHLIVSTYLENFKPDTTPVLPDLLHPHRNAQNLGGFLSGKAILTDDAGDALFVGSFLAEAFLDNSNHAVMRFDGTGAARGGSAGLKGIFALNRKGQVRGSFSGSIQLSAAARAQIARHRGATMKPLKTILGLVTVKPHYMMGKATTATSGQPLHTGFGSGSTGSSRHLSPWTVVAGLGAIMSFMMAAALWWSGRRAQHTG